MDFITHKSFHILFLYSKGCTLSLFFLSSQINIIFRRCQVQLDVPHAGVLRRPRLNTDYKFYKILY